MCDRTDDFDVKTLLWNFVSVSRPSETITKMIKQKELDHAKLMEDMKNEITKINAEKDATIKGKSEVLKKKLADIRECVKQHLIKLRSNIESLQTEEDYLLKSLNTVTKYNDEELAAVEEFCKFLMDVEKTRSNQFKELLRDTKAKAVEVAHILPFALDESFELEIAALNQITVCNYHHYAELKKDLNLNVKNDLREWTNEIMEIKETVKERLKSTVKKSTTSFGDILRRDSKRSKSIVEELNRFSSIKSEFAYVTFVEENYPISTEDVELWLKEVQRNLASLDASAKNIVALYKSMIMVLFHRFLEELENIKDAMASTGLCHKQEIEDFKCEMYTPTVEQLNIEYYSQLEDLLKYWKTTINNMTDTINVTYTFLKRAAGLWDGHFERVKMLQELVLRDIEKTIKNNACLTDTYEANLNIALEKLRQGINQKQLKSSLDSIYQILNKMELSYANQCSVEMNVVSKYRTMMEIEVDVLMSEIKQFLDAHPPDLERDPKKQRKRASQMSIKEEEEQPLPIQMLYCVFQVDAVKNWMYGLWEAINQYLSTGKEEILNLADEWIKIQVEKIKERFELKLCFHHPRYEHTKCAVYDKRLRELTLHDKLLSCHKKFVETKKKQLKAYKTTYDKQCDQCCLEYEEECQKIKDHMANFNSSNDVRGYGQLMKSKLQQFEENLKKLSDDYQFMCTNFIDELKVSNYKYLKSIKLFSEGGNFNSQEVNAVQKHIKKLEDSSVKQINVFIQGIFATDEKYSTRLRAAGGNVNSSLNQYIKEHEHNERLVRKIYKFHVSIREKVQPTKNLFKELEKRFWNLNTEAKKNLGNVEYLNPFLNTFGTFINDILDNAEFVKHPEPVGLYTVTNDNSKNKSYMDRLINKKLNFNGNDFISILVTTVYNSFKELEDSAKDFYQTTKHHPRLLDPSRLQPTFDDCMKELLQKYKPYLLQCEINWLEIATSFLTLLNNLKLFQENFLVSFKNAFYNKCLENLNSTITETWRQLNATAEEFNGRLREAHRRLKVMFGHPRNSKYLQDLEQDYKEITEENQKKFGTIIPPHKERLEKVYDSLTSDLNQVESILSLLKEGDTIIKLTEELTTQFDTKSRLLSSVVNKSIDKGSNEIFTNKDTEQYVQDYFETSTTSLKVASMNVLPFDNSFANPENFLVILKERVTTTLSAIETFLNNKIIKANEDFKESWVEDMKYILNLYKVKYDNKIF